MEMPNSCSKCECYIDNMYGKDYCAICSKNISHKDKERPIFCPLKPLPEKKISEYSDGGNQYRAGWNECIEYMEEEE